LQDFSAWAAGLSEETAPTQVLRIFRENHLIQGLTSGVFSLSFIVIQSERIFQSESNLMKGGDRLQQQLYFRLLGWGLIMKINIPKSKIDRRV
jgi:hypothetical protein